MPITPILTANAQLPSSNAGDTRDKLHDVLWRCKYTASLQQVTDLDILFPGFLFCKAIKQKELSRMKINGAKDPMSNR